MSNHPPDHIGHRVDVGIGQTPRCSECDITLDSRGHVLRFGATPNDDKVSTSGGIFLVAAEPR